MSERSAPTPPLWPGNLTQLRKELRARGLRLTKRFGQNFMVDPNMASRVVRAAGVGGGDVVLEVGPGAGHLTAAILETGARVVAVEIDAGLCAMLRERLDSEKSFRLVGGSVLAKGDVLNPAVVEALGEEMSAAGRDSFRVASNLPYNVGARFLIALAMSDVPWSGGAVTLQREVAERLAAGPGTKDYGAVTVIWRLLAEGRLDRTVPPEVFWPRPKVASALLVIAPHVSPRRHGDTENDGGNRRWTQMHADTATPFLRRGVVGVHRRESAVDAVLRASVVSVPSGSREFAGFVKALFSSRRKVLRSAVAKAFPSLPRPEVEAALAAAGIDPSSRAEDVAPEELLELWRRLGQGDE